MEKPWRAREYDSVFRRAGATPKKLNGFSTVVE
jgi:hypothetical protein